MNNSATLTCASPSTMKIADQGGLFPFTASTTLEQIHSSRQLMDEFQMTEAGHWKNFKPLHLKAQRLRGKPEADEGSLIHRALQLGIAGEMSRVPARLHPAVVEIKRALDDLGLEIVASEENVVAFSLLEEPVAGTRDLLCRTKSGEYVVVDLKTSSDLGGAKVKAIDWAIQVAIYANNERLHPAEFARDRWRRPIVNPDLTVLEERPINREYGLVIELCRETLAIDVHELDLVAGLENAKLAVALRQARKREVHRTLLTASG